MVQNINLKDLKTTLATAQIPVLVMFRTKWCKMCDVDLIVINEIQKNEENEFLCCAIDVDENKLWREQNNENFVIDKVPFYKLYYKNQILYNGDENITNCRLTDLLKNLVQSNNKG